MLLQSTAVCGVMMGLLEWFCGDDDDDVVVTSDLRIITTRNRNEKHMSMNLGLMEYWVLDLIFLPLIWEEKIRRK